MIWKEKMKKKVTLFPIQVLQIKSSIIIIIYSINIKEYLSDIIKIIAFPRINFVPNKQDTR